MSDNKPPESIVLPFATIEEALAAMVKKKSEKPAKKVKSKPTGRPENFREPKAEKEFTAQHFFRAPVGEELVPSNHIYQVLHIYTREGDSWQQTLADGKDERKYRNTNVRIVIHDHSFAEHCSPAPEQHKCREV